MDDQPWPIASLNFASYFSYAPRTGSDVIRKRAKDQVLLLKSDQKSDSGLPQSALLVRQMTADLESSRIRDFFESKPVLVPVPRSAPMQQGYLWVPNNIAEAMVSEGVGRRVSRCLVRHTRVPKSAFSLPQDRPKAKRHRESFKVDTLEDLDDMVLVDDVVTRGATMMGAANSLATRFPKARIRAFGLVRVQSWAERFVNFVDPCTGTITLQADGNSSRHP